MSNPGNPHSDETSDEFEDDPLSDEDLENVAGGWGNDDNGGG